MVRYHQAEQNKTISNMKRIIALYGHAECGKSRTMNILRELIRENGKSISSNPPYSGEQRETFLFNGQVVCLCPGGDDGAVVKGNFAYAASKNADIIITACRTRGESINEAYTQEKNLNIKAEWFRKSYEYHLCQDTLERCNQEFARVMFDALSK